MVSLFPLWMRRDARVSEIILVCGVAGDLPQTTPRFRARDSFKDVPSQFDLSSINLPPPSAWPRMAIRADVVSFLPIKFRTRRLSLRRSGAPRPSPLVRRSLRASRRLLKIRRCVCAMRSGGIAPDGDLRGEYARLREEADARIRVENFLVAGGHGDGYQHRHGQRASPRSIAAGPSSAESWCRRPAPPPPAIDWRSRRAARRN